MMVRLIPLFGIALIAAAQQPTQSIDLPVPEAPALTVLGLTPSNVTRPSTGKDLAASLLNGIDRNGNVQTGMAIDIIPYLLAVGRQIEITDYRASYAKRFISRVSFSVATTQTRLAAGLRLSIFDWGDPRADKALDACFEAAFNSYLSNFNVQSNTNDAPNAKKTSDYAQCVEASRKRNGNKSSWIIAVAPAWSSPTGRTADMRSDGGALWTSLAYGFGPGELVMHARYRQGELVQNTRQNTALGGFQLRIGSADFALALEGIYVHRQVDSQAGSTKASNSFESSISADVRLADGVWFNLGLGSGSGRLFLSSQIQWGFTQKLK